MDTKIKEAKVRKNGFTLIEILVVIGMIALLAAIVLIAINPARQFAQGRNTQRISNVETILNAVGQNMADNKGLFNCSTAASLPSAQSVICKGTSCGTGAAASSTIDLACIVPTYVNALPSDPKIGTWTDVTNYNTGYEIYQNAQGRVTIVAPQAALEAAIVPAQSVSTTR